MNRKEKYKLERALIELANVTNDLVRYANEQTFINMFDDPVGQIDDWFKYLPGKYREAPCQKKK